MESISHPSKKSSLTFPIVDCQSHSCFWANQSLSHVKQPPLIQTKHRTRSTIILPRHLHPSAWPCRAANITQHHTSWQFTPPHALLHLVVIQAPYSLPGRWPFHTYAKKKKKCTRSETVQKWSWHMWDSESPTWIKVEYLDPVSERVMWLAFKVNYSVAHSYSAVIKLIPACGRDGYDVWSDSTLSLFYHLEGDCAVLRCLMYGQMRVKLILRDTEREKTVDVHQYHLSLSLGPTSLPVQFPS